MRRIMNRFFILFLTMVLASGAMATKSRSLPRFVTTKSNQVNARKGPGATYPINWVLVKKSEPLKVIKEFEDWQKEPRFREMYKKINHPMYVDE